MFGGSTLLLLLLGGGGSAPPTDPDLLSAIRTRLLANPALSALSGVHLDVAPAKLAYPFAVISWIGAVPENNNGGRSYYEPTEVQVTVIASDDSIANTLGWAAYRTLTPKPA